MNGISLFSGCLGLDLGLEAVGFNAVGYVENDVNCQRVIAVRRPGVPIIGDVRDTEALKHFVGIDWLAGGFPCQDLSYAGKGAGLDGERSGLWFDMADAIRLLRPRLVLVENVPGLATRGLGRVLYDLAEAGYVGSWLRLRAADVGAPHGRDRLFILAADSDGLRVGPGSGARRGDQGDDRSGRPASPSLSRGPEVVHAADAVTDSAGAPAGADGSGRGEQRRPVADGAEDAAAERAGEAPADADGGRREQHDEGLGRAPVAGARDASDVSGREATPDTAGGPGRGRRAASGADARPRTSERDGDGHDGPSEHGAPVVAAAPDADGSGSQAERAQRGGGGEEPAHDVGDDAPDPAWGAYEGAVRRWESILGRAAPRPTDARGRLNPRFVEWMLGFPDGWVDVDGVKRTAQLRMLGNSVQVQCGALLGGLLLEAYGGAVLLDEEAA